jgi:hypothetical protein
MPVDRLSVTVPAELGAALRALAESRGQPVSTIVTEAIAHEIRRAALGAAVSEDERRFGPIPAEIRAEVDAELANRRLRKPRPRRKSS